LDIQSTTHDRTSMALLFDVFATIVDRCGSVIREMPKLEAFFHYRNPDVSALEELARHRAPEA